MREIQNSTRVKIFLAGFLEWFRFNGWPHIEIPMYISEMLKWLTNLEIFHISLYYLFNKLDWNDLQEFVT